MQKEFNIILKGTGGQGVITLLWVIIEAAIIDGYDVRTSELHGLSQRGGSVEAHIRFGSKIYSPMVARGRADLILGLEMQEVLRAVSFANSKTKFLINKYIIPIPLVKNLTQEEILANLKKISRNITLVPASEICKKEFGNDVVAGIYLLSFASAKGLIPIKPKSMLKAIKKKISKKHLALNLKAFNLAQRQL